MADSFIQVPPDAGGKMVDTNTITRPDSSIVHRQRYEIPKPVIAEGDVLRQILIELRLHSILLAQAHNITDDLNQLRTDIATTEDLD